MGSFIVRITEDDGRFKLSWNIPDGDDVWPANAYSVDAGLLQQAAHGVRQQLQSIAFAPNPLDRTEFALLLQRLASRGQDLFLQLMPPPDSGSGSISDVQERLERLVLAPGDERYDFKVVLETPELFVPWGFVFSGKKNAVPSEPTLTLADLRGFWVSRFNISITYGGSRPLPQERKINSCKLLALHEDMFSKAREAIKDERCLSKLDKLLAGKMAPVTDWESFEGTWTQVKDDHDSILYLYGHSDGQRIQLRDNNMDEESDPKFELLAASLKKFRKRAPGSASIFLLNGCRTAAPNPSSQDEPLSANFLKESRQSGYYGFIGTEAQVSNIFACRYGTEFLWQLFQEGRSVGEAFDELLHCPELFPQNLLYSCYAERKFRLASFLGAEKRL